MLDYLKYFETHEVKDHPFCNIVHHPNIPNTVIAKNIGHERESLFWTSPLKRLEVYIWIENLMWFVYKWKTQIKNNVKDQ